jgi:ketosteroid isomerase-like protein
MRSLVCIAALLSVVAPAAGQSGAGTTQEAAVAVVRAFHTALAAGDSTTAVLHLHPDVVIYESGRAETLTEYRQGHLSSDIAFASATRREITVEAVDVRGDQALYTAESRTTGRWRDRDIDAYGTETMVLLRTPDGWRIRHIHWSSR